MANWYGSARSNYFRVQDEEAFLSWVNGLPGIEAKQEEKNGSKHFVLLEENGEGWPSFSYDERSDEDTEIDVAAELAGHLAEGEVAILQEVGAEKLRYLTGYSIAVNHKGEQLWVSINDIYQKVKDAGWGNDVEEAAY